jgi:hypothetical protein
MSREVVTSLYCHKPLISFIILDRQRQPLMRIDIKRHEIWEWSDHTRSDPLTLHKRCRCMSEFRASDELPKKPKGKVVSRRRGCAA